MKMIQTQLTLTLDEATTKTLVEILTPAIKQALGLTLSDEDQRKETTKQRLLHVFVEGSELPKEESLLVSIQEVSELLQISARTIWRMCDAGEIPPPNPIWKSHPVGSCLL